MRSSNAGTLRGRRGAEARGHATSGRARRQQAKELLAIKNSFISELQHKIYQLTNLINEERNERNLSIEIVVKRTR